MTHTPAILSLVFAVSVSAQTKASPTLDVYVIDVEGGNAVLFVSPSHENSVDRYRQRRHSGRSARCGPHRGCYERRKEFSGSIT